jgi:hypothetical protein
VIQSTSYRLRFWIWHWNCLNNTIMLLQLVLQQLVLKSWRCWINPICCRLCLILRKQRNYPNY